MNVLERLDRVGAVLLDRHFVYKSGKHGSGYINPDIIFSDLRLASDLAALLALPFAGKVDTVASPATGGVALTVLSGKALLDQGADVAAIWADKKGDDFAFERAGFVGHLRGKRVLIVEDLLTTGGSVERVCRQAEKHGAEIVAVSAICNRGGVSASDLGVPRLESLANVRFEAVDQAVCPLCAERRPIVEDVGHGDRYKASHPAYPGGYVRLLVG